MRNTVENNRRIWDQDYIWQDGDEWQGQAEFSGQPYQLWKDTLIETFLVPRLHPSMDVLEIGPGRGRWTNEIVGKVRSVVLVDLSERCIGFCKKRFADRDDITYHVGNGRTLPVPAESVDFVWSFDSFVHMDRPTVASYVREIHRVLRPGGSAHIHHSARRHGMLWAGFLLNFGRRGRRLYQLLSMPREATRRADGWKSSVSNRQVAKLARKHALEVSSQRDRWGDDNEFRLHVSSMTLLLKPGAVANRVPARRIARSDQSA